MGDPQEVQSKMGDAEGVKGRRGYNGWSDPEHKLLLQLLVDAIIHGFRDASNKFNKLTVETRILSELHQQLGSTKNYSEYKNRMKILKGKYQTLADFLRCNSGFGWDHETKKFIGEPEVWDAYLKAHPGNTHLRDDKFEDFEHLKTIFEKNIASGQNAMGSGDTIDTQTREDVDTEGTQDTSFVQMMDDADGLINEQASEHVVLPSSRTSMREKLPQRKKARTNAYASDKICDDVTEISSQIFGMIQKRWEKEAEEKETKDKANNVWDAIKEIPDLDEDLRYEAMTLVHSLGMKFGFVNMSIADRRGWIKRNLRKPSG